MPIIQPVGSSAATVPGGFSHGFSSGFYIGTTGGGGFSNGFSSGFYVGSTTTGGKLPGVVFTEGFSPYAPQPSPPLVAPV